MSFEIERELTTLEYVVLGMTAMQPQSGYNVISAFDSDLYRWSASPGSIYPMLKRLERQGVLESELETIYETRPRKMYRPTELGCTLLDEWLVAPVSKNEVSEERDILLLKFLFMEKRLDLAGILAWLENYMAALDTYETLLRAQRDPQFDEWSVHQQLLIEASIMDLNVQRMWIQMARNRLEVAQRQL